MARSQLKCIHRRITRTHFVTVLDLSFLDRRVPSCPLFLLVHLLLILLLLLLVLVFGFFASVLLLNSGSVCTILFTPRFFRLLLFFSRMLFSETKL